MTEPGGHCKVKQLKHKINKCYRVSLYAASRALSSIQSERRKAVLGWGAAEADEAGRVGQRVTLMLL